MKSVSMKWAANNVNKIKLIDVRTPAEFENGYVEGSRNIPLTKLIKEHKKFLNKEEEFYIMCYSGGRSLHAITELEKQGYNKLINVEGGYSAK